MIIKGNTLNEESPVLYMRWVHNGVYGQAVDVTGEGVEVPDDLKVSEVIDWGFYGNAAMTQQIVGPQYPDGLEAPRAA